LMGVTLDSYTLASDQLLSTLAPSHRWTLQRLSLRNCTTITDRGIFAIKDLGQLSYLDVSFCRITDDAVLAIAGNSVMFKH
jgi:hypothetical protein